MLSDIMGKLIEYAVLDIIEFDIHTRSEMNIENRILPYYVMSYIKQGTAHLHMRGQTYVADPGTVIIIPQGELHDHVKASNESATFLWWHFNFKIAETIDILKLFKFPVTFRMNNSIFFESSFYQYVEFAKKPTTIPNVIMRRAKGLEVMAILMEEAMQYTPNSIDCKNPPEFIDILAQIINYPEEDICLKKLSQKYNMHPTYISNRFKKFFGISPIMLQRVMLHEKAKMLLKSGDITVSEVASKLGYNDISAFSRFFSSKEGIAPLKYKMGTK